MYIKYKFEVEEGEKMVVAVEKQGLLCVCVCLCVCPIVFHVLLKEISTKIY